MINLTDVRISSLQCLTETPILYLDKKSIENINRAAVGAIRSR
jgi:hypothetical protein